MKIQRYFFVIFYMLGLATALSQGTILFNDDFKKTLIGEHVSVLTDSLNILVLNDVVNQNHFFKPNKREILNLGLSRNSHWLKFEVENQTNAAYLMLLIDQASINYIALYTKNFKGLYTSVTLGEHQQFKHRKYKHPVYLFDLDLPTGTRSTFYMKVKSDEPIN
ncbi:MAG: 7TM-DISM domain-containing protein, partial [Lutibacter sp.]|nr:7TM-DISM domain-containing protein [Lutibacter sp.]